MQSWCNTLYHAGRWCWNISWTYVLYFQHVIRFRVHVASKAAKVKPVFKKRKNIEPTNYRPVSCLPVRYKVIEMVGHNQLTEHIEKYDIIFWLSIWF